jgi:transcriptional regulator of met regulon
MKDNEARDVEVPDFTRVLTRIRGEQARAKVVEFKAAANCEVAGELAMAARNGADIPEEIRHRMNADREAAEEEQDGSNDG